MREPGRELRFPERQLRTAQCRVSSRLNGAALTLSTRTTSSGVFIFIFFTATVYKLESSGPVSIQPGQIGGRGRHLPSTVRRFHHQIASVLPHSLLRDSLYRCSLLISPVRRRLLILRYDRPT